MIVAYAGRRAHSLGADPALLADRVRRLVAALQPAPVIGAAADGADLLILKAVLAAAHGTAVYIVLPTNRAVFAHTSVGPGWRDRFEAVLDEVTGGRGTFRTLNFDAGEAVYREANHVILDSASELAQSGPRVVALVVARSGEGQTIEDFVRRAELVGIPSLRVDPTVVVASSHG